MPLIRYLTGIGGEHFHRDPGDVENVSAESAAALCAAPEGREPIAELVKQKPRARGAKHDGGQREKRVIPPQETRATPNG